MTDPFGQALDVADKVKVGLDMATPFAPAMGPAAPWVMLADTGLNLLLGAAHAVYSGHNGGKSWADSLKEAVDHFTPGRPNSPFLSAPAAG